VPAELLDTVQPEHVLGSLRDVVQVDLHESAELVAPCRRGLLRTQYAGTTPRDHLGLPFR